MPSLDDSDKAFIELAIMKGFEAHREKDHKPVEAQINRLNQKIAAWGGGLAVIVGIFELVRAWHP